MKSLTTGRVIENTFTSGVKVTTARVERRPYQFLYADDMGYNFMHLETFEQITIQAELLENADLMKEGQEVEIVVHADNETPLSVDLPAFVELEISYTEPGEKGNTASTSALKPAELETGAKINVPLFINTGEKIKVDTRDRSYSERVKS